MYTYLHVWWRRRVVIDERLAVTLTQQHDVVVHAAQSRLPVSEYAFNQLVTRKQRREKDMCMFCKIHVESKREPTEAVVIYLVQH